MTRHLAIGDLHGCFDALMTLCEAVDLRKDDVIVTLGDYCDRGPSTRAVFDCLIDLSSTHQLKPIRGNHDIMMLNARFDPQQRERWLRMGGDAALRSYAPLGGDVGRIEDVPDAHWTFLNERLLPFYETDSHFFVHASAYADVPLCEQPDSMLYWEKLHDPAAHVSGKTMICGHTSQKSGRPKSFGHAVCIDTWACGDGWLSCLDVESGLIWQAKQDGEVRRLWLDEIAEE